MTPVPQPEHRPAYRDPRERLYVGHLLEAAHLVERGHQMLNFEVVGYTREYPGTKYVFDRSASADLRAYRKIVEELSAQKERFLTARNQTFKPIGETNHERSAR
jgi:hypothetical protein